MSRKPMTDWSAQPLGKVHDAEIARRLGCPQNTVTVARGRLGILPYVGPRISSSDRDLAAQWRKEADEREARAAHPTWDRLITEANVVGLIEREAEEATARILRRCADELTGAR